MKRNKPLFSAGQRRFRGYINDKFSVKVIMAATLQEIAAKAGVSTMTVSQVLRDLGSFKPETRRRIQRAARELGYRPNAQARAMRSRRTGLVGIVVPNSPLPELSRTHLNMMEAVLGLNMALDSAGYVSTLVPVTDLPGKDHPPSRVFREQMLDAMVILGHMPPSAGVDFERLSEPCVWVDSDRWESTCCIRRDEYHAGKLVGTHLAERGYRRWVLLNYPEGNDIHYSTTERRRGVAEAADAAGVRLEERIHGAATADRRSAWLEGLDVSPETAVIAANAYFAQGVVGEAAMLGVRPGTDFGLICCEDSAQLERTLLCMSRVRFARHDMGQRAAIMVLQLIRQPDDLPVSQQTQDELCVGATTPGPQV